MPGLETDFLLALAISIVIETAVLFLALKLLVRGRTYPLSRVLFAGWLCSFSTLPYLWFILPRFVNGPWYPALGEALVIVVEAAILSVVLDLRARWALPISLLCNLSSMFAGKLILGLFKRL